MKTINQYITEKFKINSDNITKYHYHPKDKEELIYLINKLIKERGENADLNDIDVSNIKDMSQLFDDSRLTIKKIDISKWDVSNVTNMKKMFNAQFNFDCNLGKWDVSNVTNMERMFDHCMEFNGEGLENWNTEKVENMTNMFNNCYYLNKNNNKPKWYK